MHSLDKHAYSLKLCGMLIRPPLSNSTVCAGAMRRRTTDRSLPLKGDAAPMSFDEKLTHSATVNSHKQRSTD